MEIRRDPQPITVAELYALPDCCLELLEGEMVDGGPGREGVLRLLLKNVGLDQVVKLVPRHVWLDALVKEMVELMPLLGGGWALTLRIPPDVSDQLVAGFGEQVSRMFRDLRGTLPPSPSRAPQGKPQERQSLD